MSTMLTIRDETTAGATTNEMVLEILTERITVRELIHSRVFQEVKDYNAGTKNTAQFKGLVQPTQLEEELNGPRTQKSRTVDFQQQFDVAVKAFESSRVLILVDEMQVDSLDDEIEVKPGTAVSFLRLTPLVGG